jgi:integrase
LTKPYRYCSCRAPATTGPDGKRRLGKLLGSSCPRLKTDSRHGAWYARYELPAGADGKRRWRRIGPKDTRKEAADALAGALTERTSGARTSDRDTLLADYLPKWLEWKTAGLDPLKPSTAASYREAIGLYFTPGLGHVKLGDISESDVRALYSAMKRISRAEDDSDLMRRLLAARSTWHGKRISTRPLTDARIRRLHAVLRAALNDASIPSNPAAAVKMGKVHKARPLLWTAARTERWRQTGEIPSRRDGGRIVMTWTPEQCGQFLDSIEQERLYPLFHLGAYYGLRRGELIGLTWADVDLATRRLHVRDDVKSDDSDRIIAIDQGTVDVLRAWQGQQMMERLEWGDGWQDSGRVFTREDGRPVRLGWVTERFRTLAAREGLPPVTFHGLRHGSASMLLAAGVDLKVVSQTMGHATAAFTADVYVTVLEEMAEAAASAIEAFVPRKGKSAPGRAINVSYGAEDDH